MAHIDVFKGWADTIRQDIDGTWDTWHQIDDIFAAGREERAYTVDPATGTITFGSGQVSGNFFLRFNNRTTSAIAWSATNNTLRDNIDAALEALGNIGSGGVTTAVDSMTAGIGTITVTFAGNNAKKDVVEMTVPSKTTSGTIAVTTSTPGVVADGRTSPRGTLIEIGDTGAIYANTGTSPNPTWTQVVTP